MSLIPWHISTSAPGCSGFAVVKNSDGKLVGCHPTKAKALAQLAALNINVKGEAMDLEERFLGIAPVLAAQEIREDGDGSAILTGHFAVFNEWADIESVKEGRFIEKIAPGAFVDSFARETPKILFQHGRDPQIGEKPIAAPVTVREDEIGAYYEAPMFRSVPPLLVEGIEAGAYGASFKFSIDERTVDPRPQASERNPDRLPEHTLTKVTAYEGGPVTWGAYKGATSTIRSLTDEFGSHDFDSWITWMAREHPHDLAARIEKALQGVKDEPPKAEEPPQPALSKFRTQEEWLQWLSKN